MKIKELRELAKRFRDKEAGGTNGVKSMRADTAWMWVSRFIDFVDEKTQGGGKQ